MFQIKKEFVSPLVTTVRELAGRNQYDLVPRVKNLISMRRHRLHYRDIKETLLSLVPEDLYKEPVKDIKGGAFWVFKKSVPSRRGNTPFYIKLKIVDREYEKFVKRMSFHEYECRDARRIRLV